MKARNNIEAQESTLKKLVLVVTNTLQNMH